MVLSVLALLFNFVKSAFQNFIFCSDDDRKRPKTRLTVVRFTAEHAFLISSLQKFHIP